MLLFPCLRHFNYWQLSTDNELQFNSQRTDKSSLAYINPFSSQFEWKWVDLKTDTLAICSVATEIKAISGICPFIMLKKHVYIFKFCIVMFIFSFLKKLREISASVSTRWDEITLKYKLTLEISPPPIPIYSS